MGNSARDFFTPEEKEDIKRAVELAELDTSGEIRVHIEGSCPGDPRDRAAQVFEKLGMHKTVARNGVLYYLAVKNRKFAILGDVGINSAVDDDFWERIRDRMLLHFRENRFAEGLNEAIQKTGEQLKEHFPHMPDDVNELPDEVSFGSK